MLFEDLIEMYGSASQAARYLGITKQAITNWQRRGYIPYASQLLIQEATSNALKANKDQAKRYKLVRSNHKLQYRLYSDLYGMCQVCEIKFRKDRNPRIKYMVGDRIMYSFSSENLMQSTDELDIDGNSVYEGDCVEYTQINEKHQYKFLSIENIRYLRNLKPFKIIGNIYENK